MSGPLAALNLQAALPENSGNPVHTPPPSGSPVEENFETEMCNVSGSDDDVPSRVVQPLDSQSRVVHTPCSHKRALKEAPGPAGNKRSSARDVHTFLIEEDSMRVCSFCK